MKMIHLMAMVAMTLCAHLSAESRVATQSKAGWMDLSADELAFVAKLSDLHRKTFCEEFTPAQRDAAIQAFASAKSADDAVEKVSAQSSSIAVNEEQE